MEDFYVHFIPWNISGIKSFDFLTSLSVAHALGRKTTLASTPEEDRVKGAQLRPDCGRSSVLMAPWLWTGELGSDFTARRVLRLSPILW